MDDRERLGQDIVAYLRDGVSVNLVALPGSGATRVADQVADRLREDGFTVLVVRAVAALRDRPLAVLALAGVAIAAPAPADVIPRAVESLGSLLPSARSALIIDDADDLDAASAGVVAAAHAQRRFPALTVTRPTGRQQAPTGALTGHLRPGVRLTLEPLGFDQVHLVVHDLLPGAVEPSAIAQIATLSGGLPGLVRAIVDTGQRTGSIVRQGTAWRVVGDLWSARLATAVEPLLAGVDDEEAAALTRLSRLRTVPVQEIGGLMAEPVFARLGARGLLDVVNTGGEALVGVFPPVVAEYLRRTGPDACGAAASSSSDRGATTSDWDAHRESLTSSLVSVINTRIVDRRRAEVAAMRAAWQAEPTVANAVALLGALNAASAGAEEFEAVLRGTRPGAAGADSIRFLGWQALYRGILLRDLDAARALLAGRRAEDPAFATRLRADEALLCLAAGAIPEPALLAEAEPAADAVTRDRLDFVRRQVLVYAGRTTDALAGLPEAANALSDYPEALRGTVVLARVFDGDLGVGIGWATQAMAQAQDRLDAGRMLEYAYLAGQALMFAGRVDDAQALLDPVLALTGPTMMHEYYHAGVLGLAGLAAGWRGRQDYCQALTAQAEAVGRRSGPFPEILRLAADALAGRPRPDDGAGEAFWAAVKERLTSGHVAAGLALAASVAEVYPQAEGARVVVRHAADVQSPFLAALGRYTEAVVTDDSDGLAECAADFRRLGAMLYAVKAGVARALVLRRRGELGASIEQAEGAWTEAGQQGSVPVGLFYGLGRALGLSEREREIARLIADGLSSQAVGTNLGLSHRTVDNYLSSAYRKLGSTGRADLVRAITTWAGQA